MDGTTIDARRLQRAVWLSVEPLGYGHCYRVANGSRSHFVNLESATASCDCWDYLYRGAICAHQLSAALREGEPSVVAALRLLIPSPKRRTRPVEEQVVA